MKLDNNIENLSGWFWFSTWCTWVALHKAAIWRQCDSLIPCLPFSSNVKYSDPSALCLLPKLDTQHLRVLALYSSDWSKSSSFTQSPSNFSHIEPLTLGARITKFEQKYTQNLKLFHVLWLRSCFLKRNWIGFKLNLGRFEKRQDSYLTSFWMTC